MLTERVEVLDALHRMITIVPLVAFAALSFARPAEVKTHTAPTDKNQFNDH